MENENASNPKPLSMRITKYSKTYTTKKLVNCNDEYGFFNNITGTCWMISILMIVLLSNKTALNNLNNFNFNEVLFNPKQDLNLESNNEIKDANYKYLNMLPKFFFIDNNSDNELKHEYKILIIKFFKTLKERLEDKRTQQNIKNARNELINKVPQFNNNANHANHSNLNKKNNVKTIKPKLRRQPSISSMSYLQNKKSKINRNININNNNNNKTNQYKNSICEYKLNNIYNKLFSHNKNNRGGSRYDSFNLQLLISIFLCNDLYYYNCKLNNPFDLNILDINSDFENILGIKMSIGNHSICFYKCNDKLYFCNNSFIQEFNWKYLVIEYIYKNIINFNNGNYKLYFHKYSTNFFIITNKNNHEEIFKFNPLFDSSSKQIDIIIPITRDFEKIKNLIIKGEIEEVVRFEFINKIEKPISKSLYLQNHYDYYLYMDLSLNDKEYIYYIKNIISKMSKEELNTLTNDKTTPLIKAIHSLNEISVEIILNNENSLLNIQDNDGRTELIISILINIEQNSEDIVKKKKKIISLLLERKDCDLNIQDKDGDTALILAVNENNKDIVKLLIERKDCDLNIQNKNGNTALILAIEKEYIDIIKLLLDKDCEINKKDINGETELIIAVNKNNKDIVKLLIERKDCDLNTQDKNGNTALILAIENQYIDIIKLLIDKNSDLNMQDINGDTALMIAISKEDISIIKLLIKRQDYDVNIKNNDQKNILQLVQDSKNSTIKEIITKYFINKNQSQKSLQKPLQSHKSYKQHKSKKTQNLINSKNTKTLINNN